MAKTIVIETSFYFETFKPLLLKEVAFIIVSY